MGKCSLTCFGVGDGWPCGDRNHSAFLYRFGGASILVDCGEPLSRSFKASGLSPELPDSVFISHLHADHTAGFFMFVQGLWLERRTKLLRVHMPSDGIKPFKQLMQSGMVYPELLQFKLRFEPLRAKQPVTTAGIRVTPCRTSHLDQLRLAFQKRYPQKFQAFCFLIEAGRIRVAHSADLGRPEDLEPLLQKPLDLLVCELAHFSPESMFRYLRGRKIKRIVFVHLARPYWDNLRRTREAAARMLGGIPATFAKDGEEVAF
jgi:ribonuclease BN (tRNA processing enzyme)